MPLDAPEAQTGPGCCTKSIVPSVPVATCESQRPLGSTHCLHHHAHNSEEQIAKRFEFIPPPPPLLVTRDTVLSRNLRCQTRHIVPPTNLPPPPEPCIQFPGCKKSVEREFISFSESPFGSVVFKNLLLTSLVHFFF